MQPHGQHACIQCTLQINYQEMLDHCRIQQYGTDYKCKLDIDYKIKNFMNYIF